MVVSRLRQCHAGSRIMCTSIQCKAICFVITSSCTSGCQLTMTLSRCSLCALNSFVPHAVPSQPKQCELPFSAIVQRIPQKADSDPSDFGGAAHALSRVSSVVRNAKAAWADHSVIALIVTTESKTVNSVTTVSKIRKLDTLLLNRRAR